eukprot:TRINITY_DN66132_c0_g1_i1.p1 TRINITY_DN66132_c0_g1~~TRINITY_DN66132_c0_g1_i1.p1  ORF type:complete len:781 (+),score=465.52 TRINITY_DN66132_c0_g1_i1:192-2345(+)
MKSDMQRLHALYKGVTDTTAEVREECTKLLQEQKDLLQYAERLRYHLSFFDEADRLEHRLSTPHASATHSFLLSDEFGPMLARLEECLSYVNHHLDFKDARKYRARFKQLHLKVLNSVKAHCTATLKDAAAHVMQQKTESRLADLRSGSVSAGAASSAQAFVEFRTAAKTLRPIIRDTESRTKSKPYRVLLNQCLQTYYTQRDVLLREDVERYIAWLAKEHSLGDMARMACSYLIEICTLEFQLFHDFFSPSPSSSQLLDSLLQRLCGTLYTLMRPIVIQQTEIDALCDVIAILKFEVLDQQIVPRGESMAQLATVVERILKDLQERLAYRAQMFVRDRIEAFVPSDDDLDYPARLTRQHTKSLTLSSSASVVADGGDSDNDADENKSNDTDKNEKKSKNQVNQTNMEVHDPYATWYVTLERTLLCLSKLYRCLEESVFRYVAQHTVSLCTSSLLYASGKIAERAGKCDGYLFLIKNLLILREQISPFEVDFAIAEQTLDLSHMTDLIPSLLRSSSSIRNLRSFLAVVERNEPKIQWRSTDSKRNMEKELKMACEQFISYETHALLGDLLELVKELMGGRSATTSPSSENGKGLGMPRARSALCALLSQLVPQDDDDDDDGDDDDDDDSESKKQEGGSDGTQRLSSKMRELMRKMHLYLANPVTEKILLKPIKKNLSDASQSLTRLVEDMDTSDDEGRAILDATTRLQRLVATDFVL